MNVQKRKLITLLSIEAVLSVIHLIFDSPPKNIQTWYLETGWHYWLAMGFGIYLVYYIINSKCTNCNKPQIYRGINPSEWYWPNDKCWNCGENQVNKK